MGTLHYGATVACKSFANGGFANVGLPRRAWPFVLSLGTADVSGVFLGTVAAGVTCDVGRVQFFGGVYLEFLPIVLLFPIVYWAAGLYNTRAHCARYELRGLVVSTCAIWGVAFAVFSIQEYGLAPLSFLGGGVCTLMASSGCRCLARLVCCRRRWWGRLVIVVGSRDGAEKIIRFLEERPKIGLRAVARFERPELAVRFACEGQVRNVIFTLPVSDDRSIRDFLECCRDVFPKAVRIPGFSTTFGRRSESSLSGAIALQLRRGLLSPWARLWKRVFDSCLVIISAPVVLPLMIIVAGLVRMSSPGPALYGHRRCGFGGEAFTTWKFRSMVVNASEVLDTYLALDAALREEWVRNYKLRSDPRVTRVGCFLRRMSLDELPQLWNVVRGEMSLVGPRPIVGAEARYYGSAFGLYCKMRPGLTGLWQVSGRNKLSYEERVRLDIYYFQNWSVWLDVQVLARTIKVVLSGDGAY